MSRSAGVLLHPTSLPGRRLGREAERFVDWLAAAGQSWWQVLPLGPPDEYGSPYTSASAFAGWSGLLADPEAEVTPPEIAAFHERHRYWSLDWESFAGAGAAADQVRFEREWSSLRAYAAARGVRILGDLAMYVAPGSADTIARPRLFDFGEEAGAPPDYFNPLGQHWGNPLYAWPAHRAERYRWWIERFRHAFELADLTRIDHFRGFVAGWAIRPGTPAAAGHWRRGPGRELFAAAKDALGSIPIVVEDLGVITPPVRRLRDEIGAPGMCVLQFGFTGHGANPDALENHPENSVVYTGTHDHNPLSGWWDSASPRLRRRAAAALVEAGIDDPDPAWALLRLAFSSRAALAIVQIQDVLGLGEESRLNTPGTTGGNWEWRLEEGQLTPQLAKRLRAATLASARAAPRRASSRR
jgi:4-alpha-glucanotransferase